MSRRLTAAALLLGACSRDYTPAPGLNGEQIYRAACQTCHPAAANGSIFLLPASQANIAGIAARIQSGSWLMPGFPNIQGEALQRISHFVLAYSDTTEAQHVP